MRTPRSSFRIACVILLPLMALFLAIAVFDICRLVAYATGAEPDTTELKPPVVTMPAEAEPTPAPELTPEVKAAFQKAVFPGEVNPPDVGILHKNGVLTATGWYRLPTTQGVNALMALAGDPKGREVLRDIAAIPIRANDPAERVPRALRTLVADQGRDRELAWMAAVLILNPEGLTTREEQVRDRLPHVVLLDAWSVTIVLGSVSSADGKEEVTIGGDGDRDDMEPQQ